MTVTTLTKFDAAIAALNQAMHGDLEYEEALRWDARFRQLYDEHVREVIASSPQFAPLALNLEGRLGALLRHANQNGSVTLEDVERIIGVSPLVFRAFLKRLRISDTEALLHLGNGHLVSFDFSNIMRKEVH
ncbi:hypothetical protein [Aestuariivirga sp.]|uniref:hypothetical protein n=1 Tax=Aestuariivirga sp. TaxID=2650926 RepID=UPI00391AC098